MRITTGMVTKAGLLAGVVLLAGSAYAQAERESAAGFYRLDFVTKELEENKVINTRNYSLLVSEKGNNSMRIGTKVPVGAMNSITFFDVGVNIDCREIREIQGQLTFALTADISTLLGETQADAMRPPAVHQYRWASSVIVPLRKATQVYSSDDLASRRKLQLEVTATPIK